MPALWPFLAGFALALGLAWILLRRANENGRRMDLVLSSTAAARDASETVDRRFDEMRRSVEERVQSVERLGRCRALCAASSAPSPRSTSGRPAGPATSP